MADTFTLQEYYTRGDSRRLRRFPHLVGVACSVVWSSARRELVEVVGIQALTGAALAAQLLVVRSLLRHLIGVRHPAFSDLVPQVIALAGLSVLVGVAGSVLALRSRLLAQLVARHAIDRVIRRAIAVELITYEAPGFHDQLQRAQLAASVRPAAMVQDLIATAGAVLSIGGIAVALLVIQPLFCLLVLVAYIPVWVATNRAGRLAYRQTVEQTERERKRRYLFETLTSKAAAQEVRAFGIGDHLADRQDALYRTLLGEVRAVLRRRLRLAVAGQLAAAVLTSVALAALVWFVTSGRMSVAAAGSAAGAMVLLGGRLHAVAGSSAGLYEHSLYLEDYVRFVDATPEQAGATAAAVPGPPELLAAADVSFTYPSRPTPSLDGVSLRLARGEVVALVGENGSGKTTFAKLLAGLYAPQHGAVTWDGVSLQTLSPEHVRRQVAVIFQDFVRYLLPAYDNIALGDAGRFDDVAAVRAAAAAAGIDGALSALPHGYDTILGPAYFGGSDLSGGQWQRMALARLFFRDAPIVILDEPAASLDPRAEAALYESIRTLFEGRGVLLITHRFASARTADRIYVLRDGRIAEQGTHDELVAERGYYAELYELQARQFRE